VIDAAETGRAGITRLRHMRLELALHAVAERQSGPTLLLLHGLGERTPPVPPPYCTRWPGPVFGLDFTGHGSSDIAIGGGYTSEALIGDVDTALAHLGSVVLLGRGLGAYVALLTTAARPDHVTGLILGDGPGLAGGGPTPGSLHVLANQSLGTDTPDPLALAELSREVRPPELAAAFVDEAARWQHLADRLFVSARFIPPWLEAVAGHPAVRSLTLERAVAELAGMPDHGVQ
jgi:pimeloyl-ACP methyl ester carboxylesterase